MEEFQEWQKRRTANLTSESGWLTLCGLFWLDKEDFPYVFGSKSSNPIALPEGKTPEEAGHIIVKEGKIFLHPKEGDIKVDDKAVNSPVELNHDGDGSQTANVVSIGASITFLIIKRGPKLGVRAKDKQSPTRLQFSGLKSFPYDPKWRLEATFVKYDPPKPLPIRNVFDMDAPEKSSGKFQFEVSQGKFLELEVIDEMGSDEYFVIFKDLTNGKETYGMRYLYVPFPDQNGKLIVDFNKAYNPPCSFTEFATCPVPHPENRLPIRIEAGELKYGDH